MNILQGLPGASGYAFGTAVLVESTTPTIDRREIKDAAAEVDRMQKGKERYFQQLEELKEQAVKEVGESGAEIFSAYQEILTDEVFFAEIIGRIEKEKVNAEYAIEQERAATASLFEGMDDVYLRERAQDITNVCMELIAEIQGVKKQVQLNAAAGTALIVVAEDLTPADTIKMDKSVLAGMITETGGVTSHTVILAKTLGIPAITGLKDARKHIAAGASLLVDGERSTVTIDPDAASVADFQEKSQAEQAKKAVFAAKKGEPAITLDGKEIKVNINSGDEDSMATFSADSCDGIGLFRTEFLYMSRTSYPTEEEQFAVYREMAEKNQGRELIIRTLDIGGDKQIAYMDLPKESNPFLGYRAIRLCLDRTEVFKTQLRAILRAGVYGEVKIMFPMIVNVEELRAAKAILAEAKKELAAEGVSFKDNIPVGIMIETPAAVMISDRLAEESDFFSIGSNDLVQYTTACDRMNERIQGLYDNCNISVLRSMRMVCENGKKQGIMVGICGEAASETRLIPLWAAMGVEELSVVPSQVGKVKYMLSRLSVADLQRDMESILAQSSIEEVKKALDQIADKVLS